MANIGIATMYAQTDLILACKDAEGSIIHTNRIAADLRQYLLGSFTLHLQIHDLPSNTASIWFGIADPLT